MAERSALTQTIQIGVETTPGTGVAADKKLSSLAIGPGMRLDVKRFKPQGYKYATVLPLGKEWVEARVTGVGTYTELVYPLSSIFGAATITPVASSTAQNWAFNPSTTVEDAFKTFSIEQGSPVRAHKFTGGLFRSLQMRFSRDGFELGGDLIGQRITDAITMTATPTGLLLVPILGNQLDVFMDPLVANIGTTKLLRLLSGEYRINNKYNPLWVVNSANNSYVAAVEAEPENQLTLMVEADAQGMALLNTVRAGDTQFIRLTGTGPIANAAVPYSLRGDLAVKVRNVSDFQDQDGVFAVEWTFDIVHDDAWGKSQYWQLVNLLTAL